MERVLADVCACVWMCVNARERARILVFRETGCFRKVEEIERETLPPNPPNYL